MSSLPEVIVIHDFFDGRRFFKRGMKFKPTGTLRQTLIRSGHVEMVEVRSPAKAVIAPFVAKPDDVQAAVASVLRPPVDLPRRSKSRK